MAALAGAAVAWGIKLSIPFTNPIARAALILIPYGLIFLGSTWLLRIPEATTAFRRIRKTRA